MSRAALQGRILALEQRAAALQAQVADLHRRRARYAPGAAAHAALSGQIDLCDEELAAVEATLATTRHIARHHHAAEPVVRRAPGVGRPLWRPALTRLRPVADAQAAAPG
jgi:hypothetical protein